jgi:hypothetical protein
MIDSSYRTWLLEVNCSPTVRCRQSACAGDPRGKDVSTPWEQPNDVLLPLDVTACNLGEIFAMPSSIADQLSIHTTRMHREQTQ